MDRDIPAFERGPQPPKPQEPQPESEGGFVNRFLKKRRVRQGEESDMPQVVEQVKAPKRLQKIERPVDAGDAAESAPVIENATITNRLRRLGERTLGVVFETRDKLTEPFERVAVPEVAQLNDAAEDVDDALEHLDDAKPERAKLRTVRIEAPADMRIEHPRLGDEQSPVQIEASPDPANPEDSYAVGWADGVKSATRAITHEMSQRFERIGREPKRAASAAEIGVVAVLLGGALGMLFVSERRSAKATKRELKASKKQQQVFAQRLEHQTEVIQQQEQELEQLAHRTAEQAPLGEVRKDARQVVTFAHRQADTIREVAREPASASEGRSATPSQGKTLERTTNSNPRRTPERPPLVPGAFIEPEKPSLIERLKPLIGLESAEQTTPRARANDDTMHGSASGGGAPGRGVSSPIATASQKILPQLTSVKQKVAGAAASSPFAWVYGLTLLAATIGAAAIVWVLTR